MITVRAYFYLTAVTVRLTLWVVCLCV